MLGRVLELSINSIFGVMVDAAPGCDLSRKLEIPDFRHLNVPSQHIFIFAGTDLGFLLCFQKKKTQIFGPEKSNKKGAAMKEATFRRSKMPLFR